MYSNRPSHSSCSSSFHKITDSRFSNRLVPHSNESASFQSVPACIIIYQQNTYVDGLSNRPRGGECGYFAATGALSDFSTRPNYNFDLTVFVLVTSAEFWTRCRSALKCEVETTNQSMDWAETFKTGVEVEEVHLIFDATSCCSRSISARSFAFWAESFSFSGMEQHGILQRGTQISHLG